MRYRYFPPPPPPTPWTCYYSPRLLERKLISKMAPDNRGRWQTPFTKGVGDHSVCMQRTYPFNVLHHLLNIWSNHFCLLPGSKSKNYWISLINSYLILSVYNTLIQLQIYLSLAKWVKLKIDGIGRVSFPMVNCKMIQIFWQRPPTDDTNEGLWASDSFPFVYVVHASMCSYNWLNCLKALSIA